MKADKPVKPPLTTTVPSRRDDLVRCLRDAGLAGVREFFGDYDLRPFSESSPALIIVGQRH